MPIWCIAKITKLGNCIPVDSENQTDGYYLSWFDRNREGKKGNGVAYYIRNGLSLRNWKLVLWDLTPKLLS